MALIADLLMDNITVIKHLWIFAILSIALSFILAWKKRKLTKTGIFTAILLGIVIFLKFGIFILRKTGLDNTIMGNVQAASLTVFVDYIVPYIIAPLVLIIYTYSEKWI